MKKTLFKMAAVATLFTPFVSSVALAAYPEQPIRIIVPFAPGGSTDIVTRIVSTKMSEYLGQPIVVENKAGAGGAVGAQEAARAKPDGYTLSAATVSSMAVNPNCKPTGLGYDPFKDFSPVTNFANVPNVVSVHPSFQAKDLNEFIKRLKDNPNKFSYGSAGQCSISHLFGEAFRQATDTDITHAPYRGAGPAVADAVAGHIEILFDNLPSSFPQIQAQKLRALAIAWPERLKDLPDVPTFKELGYAQLNQPSWYGLLAPANTPKEVIDTLHKAAAKALQDPGVKEALLKQGAFASGNTPEEFAKEIKAQFDWAHKVVSEGKLKLQ